MKRRTLIAGAGVLVAVLAAGVGIVVAQLVGSGDVLGVRGLGMVDEYVDDYGQGPVSMRVVTIPSPDLPDTQPEADGLFLRRLDNSIFIGTGDISARIEIRETIHGTEEPLVSIEHSGLELECVVTRDTVIYEDVTDRPNTQDENRKPGEYEFTVQQRVRRVESVDGIGPSDELAVWGRRSGDRVVAEVVVYRRGELGV